MVGTSYYGDQGSDFVDEETKPNPRGFGPYLAPAIEVIEQKYIHKLPLVVGFIS